MLIDHYEERFKVLRGMKSFVSLQSLFRPFKLGFLLAKAFV